MGAHGRLAIALTLWLPVAAQSIITTFAGTDYIVANGVKAVNAPLGAISSVAVDSRGTLYAADLQNFLVFKVGSDGILTVVAGTGFGGGNGDNGPAASAMLNTPKALALDPA